MRRTHAYSTPLLTFTRSGFEVGSLIDAFISFNNSGMLIVPALKANYYNKGQQEQMLHLNGDDAKFTSLGPEAVRLVKAVDVIRMALSNLFIVGRATIGSPPTEAYLSILREWRAAKRVFDDSVGA